MKLTASARYAVRAMIDLAYHSKGLPVPLSHISIRQSISLNFLEQLFAKMRRAGLVKNIKGPGGGYTLDRNAENISAKDILLAVDENIFPVGCLKNDINKTSYCDRFDNCVSKLIWKRLGNQIFKVLESMTLKELCEEQEKMEERKTLKHGFVINI